MANFRLNWNARQVIRDATRETTAILDELAEILADEIRNDIDTPTESAGPSSPGEPPHADSRELHDGIFTDSLNQLSRIVGSRAGHTLSLEFGTSDMAARPFMRRALHEFARRHGLRVVDKFNK